MSLVGWWPLHDDTAQDLSGNGNHGTVNGATAGVAGRGGLEAMSFDGEDDEVDFGSLPSFSDGSSGWAVSIWVKERDVTEGDDVTNDRLYEFRGDYYGPYVVSGGGGWTFRTYDGSEVYACTSEPKIGVWTHYVFQATGPTESGRLELYEDSVLVATEDSWDIESTSNDNRLGRDSESGYNGLACDVRVYSRTLTQSEIQTLYEWGSADLARPPTDGVAYYPLDGDATDQWGSNDGTVNGATVTDDAIRGQAYEFDRSSSDYIEVSSTLETGDSGSVFAWASLDSYESDTNIYIFSNFGSASSDRLYILVDNSTDELTVGLGDESILNSSVVFPTNGTYYHVGVVWDNGDYKTFINGSIVDSGTYPDTVSTSVENWYIGSFDGDRQYWDGNIDDLRLYDRALEPWEVHELYRWGTYGRDMRQQTVNK